MEIHPYAPMPLSAEGLAQRILSTTVAQDERNTEKRLTYVEPFLCLAWSAVHDVRR